MPRIVNRFPQWGNSNESRSLPILLAFGLLAAQTIEADAVVCAKGVYRAGCAGPHGAAVVRHPAAVRHPAPVCRYVVVNGVRVRRCV